MTIDELVLNPKTKNIITRASNQLAQGLIIEGPVGSGVSTVAKLLARTTGSPEFIVLPKKNVRNELVVDLKEGNVVIDDIRALYEQTRTRQPGRSVYVIDTGEKAMTLGAQNAFLKLLEEPREALHFIIATHTLDQLLPTIVSRCQKISLLPITDEQTASMIDSLAVTDPTKRARLAFVGRGLPALISRLVANDKLYEDRVAIMGDAKIMLGTQLDDKLPLIHKYKDNRGDVMTLLDDMNHQLYTIMKKRPDIQLAKEIDRHLSTRQRILRGGNIRLQLASDVL